MKHCLLCGELTHGSIGAAGLVWDNCCQTCKDSEDAALQLQIKAAAKGFKFILGSLGLGEQTFKSETHTPQDITTLGD